LNVAVNLIYIVTKLQSQLQAVLIKIFYIDFLKIAEIIKPKIITKLLLLKQLSFKQQKKLDKTIIPNTGQVEDKPS